jgi:hypothetical protein
MWGSLCGSPILTACAQIENGKNNAKFAYSSWNDWSHGYFESVGGGHLLYEANNKICLHKARYQ